MTQIGNLLRAAAQIVGGAHALATRLGLGERLLERFIAEEAEVPDPCATSTRDVLISGSGR